MIEKRDVTNTGPQLTSMIKKRDVTNTGTNRPFRCLEVDGSQAKKKSDLKCHNMIFGTDLRRSPQLSEYSIGSWFEACRFKCDKQYAYIFRRIYPEVLVCEGLFIVLTSRGSFYIDSNHLFMTMQTCTVENTDD